MDGKVGRGQGGRDQDWAASLARRRGQGREAGPGRGAQHCTRFWQDACLHRKATKDTHLKVESSMLPEHARQVHSNQVLMGQAEAQEVRVVILKEERID